MTLLRVHKVLIATAILFCAGFAVRDVASGDGSTWMVLRVAASAAAAITFALYLRWLVRTKASVRQTSAVRNGTRRGD
jgi:hypothetical protein